MKKLKTFSLALSMLLCFVSMAQQKTITGIVSDEVGPLPGANVVIKGTNRGTQTDLDGKYSIVAAVGDKLVFSFVGMNDYTRTVGKSNIINVTLTGAAKLEEVVVLGYQTQTKKSVKTASSVTVTSHSIQNSPNVGYIQPTQPKPTNIIIRDASLSKEEPLYIIDGKVATASETKNLAPTAIANITVLKDEKATQLYGNRADKGAIIITTKPTDTIQPNDNHEDYEAFTENVFESPRTSPLSTFSIDVDNASYTNVRRFINNGQQVPKDAVRIEEMVNFFKYNYAQPTTEHPFSIHSEYSDCPWNANNKLVRIGLQGKNIDDSKLPASNLVFLIDVSGSMASENKLPLLKQSLKVLVNQLRKEDKVAIVVYAGAAGLVLPPTSGDKKMTIIDALEDLEAGGSTAGGEGIKLAYKIAQENFIPKGNNRVVLATDGDFNVGAASDNDMQRLIEDKRKSGVFLTCLGYGMGNYKDSKMEILANKGNGNYAYIDNIQEANRFLGKEFKGSMFAIAKDVKIQIEFNPAHVQAYRLIGYENRKLRPEDFKNDAIDAGELGSGHTVTALYEIVPKGTTSEFFAETEGLKYTTTNDSSVSGQAKQTIASANADELATIKFRYKKPDGDKSIEMVSTIANAVTDLNLASEDFKFCSAVAWFGLNLRDSKLVKNKSLKDIKSLAQQGKSDDAEGYKAEFIRLIDGGNQLASIEK